MASVTIILPLKKLIVLGTWRPTESSTALPMYSPEAQAPQHQRWRAALHCKGQCRTWGPLRHGLLVSLPIEVCTPDVLSCTKVASGNALLFQVILHVSVLVHQMAVWERRERQGLQGQVTCVGINHLDRGNRSSEVRDVKKLSSCAGCTRIWLLSMSKPHV